jgi:hypothetical protein
MPEREPLQWFQVTNPHAEDVDRIGYLVRMIGTADDPDLRKRQYVIHFEDGDEGTYSSEEIKRIYAC